MPLCEGERGLIAITTHRRTAPLREEDGAEELLPTIMVDGQPQKVAYQPDIR